MKLIHTEREVLLSRDLSNGSTKLLQSAMKVHAIRQSQAMGEASSPPLSISTEMCLFPFSCVSLSQSSDESSCQFLLFSSCFSTHKRPYLADWGRVESQRLPGLTWPALLLFCSHPAPFLLPFFPCPLLNLPAWSSSRWWLGAWQLARAGSSSEGPVQPFASRQPILSLLERATLPGWPAWLKCEEGDCFPHFELNSFRFDWCPEHLFLLTVDGSGFVLLMTVCKKQGEWQESAAALSSLGNGERFDLLHGAEVTLWACRVEQVTGWVARLRFYQLQTDFTMWISCVFETLPWPTRTGQAGPAWKSTACALSEQLRSKINLLRQASSCELAGVGAVLSAVWRNSSSRGVVSCTKYFHLLEAVGCNPPSLCSATCLHSAPTWLLKACPVLPTISAWHQQQVSLRGPCGADGLQTVVTRCGCTLGSGALWHCWLFNGSLSSGTARKDVQETRNPFKCWSWIAGMQMAILIISYWSQVRWLWSLCLCLEELSGQMQLLSVTSQQPLGHLLSCW